MIQLERKYHFYAAHRNPEAGEKCGRIHGHTYKVICTFEFKQQANGITMLFEDVDKIVEPIIKDFDHWFLVYRYDPLYSILLNNNEKFYCTEFKTSAENLAIYLFDEIKYKKKLPIIKLQLMETESSNIIITI